LGLILLSLFLPEPRLWGQVLIRNKKLKLERIFLELHSTRFTGISFGKALAHENGRFLLRAGAGKYLLSVSFIGDRKEKIFLGSLPVRVNSLGSLSSTVEIIG
jgi:hypothetical protein